MFHPLSCLFWRYRPTTVDDDAVIRDEWPLIIFTKRTLQLGEKTFAKFVDVAA